MPNPIYLRKNKSTSENESKLGKLKKWLTSQLVFKWECIFYLVKLAIEMLVVVVLARIHFSKTRVWARFNEESYSDLIWHCPTHTHTHTHTHIYIYIYIWKKISLFCFHFPFLLHSSTDNHFFCKTSSKTTSSHVQVAYGDGIGRPGI
jgi:hypothetical protein